MAWTADHRGSTPPKSFFESLPRELEGAAQIDGLGWFGVFVRIVLPLSKAVLATMILAIIPILFISPFAQRHFVSGVMLGSVKG